MRVARLAGAVLALWLSAGDPILAQQRPPLTRIAFGSCAYQERPQPIWGAVLRYQPELFLFVGDNVYGDVRDGRIVPNDQAMESLRYAYAQVARVQGFMQVKNNIPHHATWDDHDYGKDDAGGDFAFKEQAQRLFVDFWNIPADDLRRSRPGIYHAASHGPPDKRIQVILLGTRYFRSPLKQTDQLGAPGKERYVPDDDLGKTMLGDTQWQWLAER